MIEIITGGALVALGVVLGAALSASPEKEKSDG